MWETASRSCTFSPLLKVEPTAYNETTKTLALDITPQYRIVASTAAMADGIELGDNGNAKVVQDYQPMNITKATVVTMELPADFASGVDKLSIQHTKSNGTVEYFDDFAYRCFYRNDYSADSYHDCGSHLSERADYEQESTGYFRGSYGSAYPYYEQSGSE